MDRRSSHNAEEDRSPSFEPRALNVLASLLPRSVRQRQIHEWRDHLDCTRENNGSTRHELLSLVRSATAIAWTTAIAPFMRVSLAPLLTAITLALDNMEGVSFRPARVVEGAGSPTTVVG